MKERFVCAADEIWRLQRGSDADCVFFQRAVNGGERITDRGTRQGTWVFAPDGTVLGRVNARSPEQVGGMARQALERWDALPDASKRLPADVELEPGHRWEHSFPEEGLALERVVRDLGPDGLAGERGKAWNRDTAWFSADEIAALVPAELAPGARFELPLVARLLARFHLVDNARGQTLPYADEEVGTARLTAEVTARVGDQLVLQLRGATAARAEGPWLLGPNLWKPQQELPHGIETVLGGRAVWDRVRRRFTSFELVAVGRIFGRTALNGRARDAAPSRLAFFLRMAPAELRLAPTFVAVYDAPWIVPPEVGTWLESPAECGVEGG